METELGHQLRGAEPPGLVAAYDRDRRLDQTRFIRSNPISSGTRWLSGKVISDPEVQDNEAQGRDSESRTSS